MSGRLVRAVETAVSPVVWIAERLMAVPLARWKRIGLAIISASFGFMLWARVFAPHGTLGDNTSSTFYDTLAVWPLGVCVFTLIFFGIYGLDPIVVAAVRRIARALPVSGNGALAVARHTLESRRPITSRTFWTSNAELGSIAFMALLLSGYAAGSSIDGAKSAQAEALTWDAVVAPYDALSVTSTAIGVDRTSLDSSVITALEADPNLAVVPFGVVTVGPVNAASPVASITVVSPADLDRFIPNGARPVGLQDGVVVSPLLDDASRMLPAPTGPIDVSTAVGSSTLSHLTWFNASTLATRQWAEATWGDVPVVGALVAYVGDDIPAADRLGYIADAARRAGADARPAPALSSVDIAYRGSSEKFSLGFLGFMAVVVVIASGVGAVILAIRTVKAHRQVRATVAALGATPRSLALAVPIDAGITHAVAFAIGLPLGVIWAAINKHPTLLRSGAPLDPGQTAWGLWWNLTHIAWGQIAAVAGITWFLAVAATAVYGFAVARRTPVDELRVAIKEGAL